MLGHCFSNVEVWALRRPVHDWMFHNVPCRPFLISFGEQRGQLKAQMHFSGRVSGRCWTFSDFLIAIFRYCCTFCYFFCPALVQIPQFFFLRRHWTPCEDMPNCYLCHFHVFFQNAASNKVRKLFIMCIH